MGAYAATAAQLCGPAIVLVASLLPTAAAQRLLPRFALFLQKHKIVVIQALRWAVFQTMALLFKPLLAQMMEMLGHRPVPLQLPLLFQPKNSGLT
jgi:hypothetical protein